MPEGKKTLVWFNEVGKGDVGLVGGKGANLGEMTNAGIPVPPGFIVTADAYFKFVEQSGIGSKIRSLLEPLNVHDS
ncbi:PEP/pyruvate-binding domain-containing protein, partial [Chloroflexota bacterium]